MLCFVGYGGGDGQFNFCARSGLAPIIQPCSDSPGTFSDPRQPPVSGATTFFQHSRVYTSSIIAYTQAKQVIIIANLSLDVTRVCVPKRISQQFTANAVEIILQRGTQVPSLTFHNDSKSR